MGFWILAASYWVHLLATIAWLGGTALSVFVALPALRRGELARNTWFAWQRRLAMVASVSLVLLLVTGLVQLTTDPNYHGFLVLDGVWAWAILLKHIVYGAMVIISVYLQAVLHPAMDRLAELTRARSQLAEAEQARMHQREIALLRLNLACAAAVLLLTAIATAV